MTSTFYIRSAVESDVELILGLVRDLSVHLVILIESVELHDLQPSKAIYEKSEDSVKATPDLLRQNLFQNSYAHALLAFTNALERDNTLSNQVSERDGLGEAIGLALYFFNYSTWTGRPGLYLEDLFVKPEHRNGGVGKALFGELGKIAQEKNCARMDWAVLTWNQPSIDFYEKVLGAKAQSEWMGMRLEEDGIEKLKRFRLSEP